MTETNVIYIGQKPIMNYVLAVGKKLGKDGNVDIRARGKAISKAVDVALITLDRAQGQVVLRDIGISTEVLPSDGNGSLNVSSIKISLGRP